MAAGDILLKFYDKEWIKDEHLERAQAAKFITKEDKEAKLAAKAAKKAIEQEQK